MANIFTLPSDILHEICIDYLTIKDLCHLDTSVCNKNNRLQLLDVFSSNYFVIKQHDKNTFHKYIKWIMMRNIKTNVIYCLGNFDIDLLNACVVKNNIKVIELNNYITNASIIKIAEHCHQLSSLTIHNNKITDASIIK